MADTKNKDMLKPGSTYLIMSNKNDVIRNVITVSSVESGVDGNDERKAVTVSLPPASYAIEAPAGIDGSHIGKRADTIPAVKAAVEEMKEKRSAPAKSTLLSSPSEKNANSD